MKKIILLFIIIITTATAYAEQSFQVKFYRKNGLAPLKYNIYDIHKINFNKLSDKYNMVIHFKKDSINEYSTNNIDSIKTIKNNSNQDELNIFIAGMAKSYLISTIDSIIFNNNPNYIETVNIGGQSWMLKNLDVSTYRNGDAIRHAASSTDWADAGNKKQGAWCYYNNDPILGAIYGKLYNWYAVNDPRGLAPSGYHVPSNAEWSALTTFLSSNSQYWCDYTPWYNGKSLAAKELWSTYNNKCAIGDNLNTNNSSGFTALPGGYRDHDGYYDLISYGGYWWSSTEGSESVAFYRYLYYSLTALYDYPPYGKVLGFSVRCIKD